MDAVKAFIKKGGLALYMSAAILAVTVAGVILFLMSYTTTYYTFGEMYSVMILIFCIVALVAEAAVFVLSGLIGFRTWMRTLLIAIIVMLALASMYLLGDRFEGIGYTIFSEFDTGHGGEEACWYSIICVILMLVAISATVVLSFFRLKNYKKI